MSAYAKLFAAIVSVLLMRWVLRITGIDLAEIDDNGDIRTLVALLIDTAVAAVSGFFVWLVPNVKAKWRAFWDRVWPWQSL